MDWQALFWGCDQGPRTGIVVSFEDHCVVVGLDALGDGVIVLLLLSFVLVW